MCGIAGYIGYDPIPEERRLSCLGGMHHRGPDARGTFEAALPDGRRLYLLHTRLKIIDLDERANQPYSHGGRTIVYNGELYNYVEIRKALECEGVCFDTESDTEVLLKALGQWGVDALGRCEGMWAFALYDEGQGTLLLCRDRFGEKPLYTLGGENGLYFASEPKAIADLRGRALEVNREHLLRYMVNGYKALYKTDHTFFEGLSGFPAATWLSIGLQDQERSASYWQPRFQPEESMSYEDAVGGVRERMIETIRLRLRADVPLAFCMSGGVDSNALISIAKNLFEYDVHGFTIVNSDTRYEEKDFIDEAVRAQGLRHTEIPLSTRDFLPRLRALVRHHDAPVITITYYVQWLLQESIAENGYRISVSGTAADELFSGYYDHHMFYLSQIHGDRDRYCEALANWQRHVQPTVRNPYLRDPERFLRNPGERGHIYFDAQAFSDYLVSPWSEAFVESDYADDVLRNRMLNELRHEAVPVILHEDDLNAMYFSVENRSPFLDRSLCDFANTIPTRHLIRNGLQKAVLRDAMRDIVPDHIIDSPRKVGFNAPILDLLDVGDPGVREYLLDESPVYELVRRDSMEQLLGKGDYPNSESKFLFYFLNAKLFLEEFAR